MNKLEKEGQQNIMEALKNIDIDLDDMTNRCTDCELRRLVINIKNQTITTYCPAACDDELLGNNAEIVVDYPDDGEDR